MPSDMANPAVEASEQALGELRAAIAAHNSFLLEAGARRRQDLFACQGSERLS